MTATINLKCVKCIIILHKIVQINHRFFRQRVWQNLRWIGEWSGGNWNAVETIRIIIDFMIWDCAPGHVIHHGKIWHIFCGWKSTFTMFADFIWRQPACFTLLRIQFFTLSNSFRCVSLSSPRHGLCDFLGVITKLATDVMHHACTIYTFQFESFKW